MASNALFALLLTVYMLTGAIAFGGRNIFPSSQESDFQSPCVPSPCGPRTKCSVNSRGAAECRCLPGYFPKPDTITGCGPQCQADSECSSGYKCIGTKCQQVCQPSPCAVNAICQPGSHQANCRCISGYEGDPFSRCHPRQIVTTPPLVLKTDPCSPSPCGAGTDCRESNGRPICSCKTGYYGDPFNGCQRGECNSNSDCPHNLSCRDYKCVSPCTAACGQHAECSVRNHVAVCSCPAGYTGDPFTSCRHFDPNELCLPSPCGSNTNCQVRNLTPVCSCKEGYIGSPLAGCRHECELNHECAANMACIDFRCKNPCQNACGELANCEVRNHHAICSCPTNYLGDPYRRCYPECISHEQCPGNKACFSLKCVNPCFEYPQPCGHNANCEVRNHKAICSCPKGYTGSPFQQCRPFEKRDLCNPNPCGSNAKCQPGHDNSGEERPVCFCEKGYIGNPISACHRGECITNVDCPQSKACYAYQCVNPCAGACGTDALCEPRNHGAVCRCPDGYTGDALSYCRPQARRGRSRLVVGCRNC